MKIKIFFMASLLTSLFGCKGQTNKSHEGNLVFPSENFSVIETTLSNGKPAVGSIDMGYKNYNGKNRYPWFLRLSIGLNLDSCYENGLPKDGEIKIANRLEDELLAEIKKIATAHYIGHLFNDTFLDVYIYLDKPKKTHDYLQTQINKEGLIRGFGYEIKIDSNWTFVKGYLQEEK